MNPFWSVAAFWIIAALFVVVALVLVLTPLLRRKPQSAHAERRDVNIAVYRDQMKEMEAERVSGLLPEDQFETAKVELESRLAEDALGQAAATPHATGNLRPLAYALGAILPIAAVSLYFWLGNPAALTGVPKAPAEAEAMMGEHDIKKMLQQAEAKVEADPKDGQSWAILGRTYATQGRWPEAWKAYQFAAELLPDDASLLSGEAEALAVIKGGTLQGEPMNLVEKALAINSSDTKALELAAASAFQEKNHAQAAAYLDKLYKLLPPDDPFAKQVLTALTDARRQAQTGGLDNLSAQPAPPPVANATIRGSLDLAPAFAAKLTGKETIFLFARLPQGGPPVAAVRGPAARFPMDFELSDRLAMNPGNLLSQHQQVTLVARISKSGGPMAQSGDLEGSVKGVAVGAKGVKLVIDRAVP